MSLFVPQETDPLLQLQGHPLRCFGGCSVPTDPGLLSVGHSVKVVVERVTIQSVQVDIADLSLGMDLPEMSGMRLDQREDLAAVIATRKLPLEA